MASSAKRTDPELWEEVKEEATEGSARKAQLAVLRGRKVGRQQPPSMDRGGLGHEVRPQEHRHGRALSFEEGARGAVQRGVRARTTRKKRKDTAKGKQFSSQPEDVKRKTARYRHGSGAGDDAPSKAELYDDARRRGLEGRSKMSKAALAKALGR